MKSVSVLLRVRENGKRGKFSFVGNGSPTRLVEQLSLYQQLGAEFFRPRKL
jgi:hypothetical protein